MPSTRIALTPRQGRFGSIALAVALLASACGSAADETQAQPAQDSTLDAEASAETLATDLGGEAALFDSSVVHTVAVEFDDAGYDQMIATYETTGEKDWIEAAVTIDGTTFENAGVRLKGNSSLFSLTTETAGNPEDLPWLISLDKYVDDQSYQGYVDLVVRSNSTETAMNEAVALELLGLAGLATEEAIATSFTVNGGEAELRLAIEHPDDEWEEANFDGDETALYKADSEGDYSYRGDDPDAYDDVFNQKVGDGDLEPLINFLEFINDSDDVTFAAELEDWLDVDSFATYLAFQDLIQNGDDIDGRGNNSYLHYDYDTDLFTVVSWDLNLAFGTANVTGPADGRGQGPGAGRDRPAPQAGGQGGDVGGVGGEGGVGAGGSNVLASRFRANDSFLAMYDQATIDLTAVLFSSGAADAIVDTWVGTLSTSASELVGVATVESDAAAIVATFPQS